MMFGQILTCCIVLTMQVDTEAGDARHSATGATADACQELAELSGGDLRRYARAVKAHADDLRPSQLAPHVIRLAYSNDLLAREVASSVLWASGRDGELANAIAIAINCELCVAHLVWLIEQLQAEHTYACYLLSDLRSHAQPAIRTAALTAIVRVSGNNASSLPDLLEALRNDGDENVRTTAVRLVAGLGPSAKPAVPLLLEILDGDADLLLKLEIAKGLQVIGPANRSWQNTSKRLEQSIRRQVCDEGPAFIATEIEELLTEQEELRQRTREARRDRIIDYFFK